MPPATSDQLERKVRLLQRMMGGEPEAFMEHAASEDPREAVFLSVWSIHGRYDDAVRTGQPTSDVASVVRRLLPAVELARRRAGPAQREIDLDLMRVIRKGGGLFCVVGAGVTVGAGGPSWPDLVQALLEIGLGQGFHIVETVPPEKLRFTQVLKLAMESPRLEIKPEQIGIDVSKVESPVRTIGYIRFSSEQAQEARAIVRAIEASRPPGSPEIDPEKLQRGAELCWQSAGQHLFAHVTQVIYDKALSPGPTHRALAELADPQELLGSKGERRFGWSALVTYNFDDLMGLALDARKIPRAAYAIRAGKLVADPNQLAKAEGQDKDHLRVLHLHGYSPMRFFYITDVTFVLTTSQYEEAYFADQKPMLDAVLKQLANPWQYALYVGCSFIDEFMNRLLEDAHEHLPGREHWALLQWKGKRPYAAASGEEIERASARFVRMGVRPIWFDDFSEIPKLILALR